MQKIAEPSWLKRVERRYAWSFLGFVIGALGVALALLALREKRPEVVFSTLSASNVLDVHTAVPSLDVTYQGQSLQRTNLNLRIINVRIENAGDVDIVQSQYDDKLLWGFRITSGRIVEIRTIGASSTYLAARLSPRRLSDSQVGFDKAILDRGSFAVIQVVVLHPKNLEPIVVPTGKIAGVDITRMRPTSPTGSTRVLPTAFAGSALVQLLRFTAYGLGFSIVLFGGIIGYSELRDARVRAKIAQRHAEVSNVLYKIGAGDLAHRLIDSIYMSSVGREMIAALQSLINDPKRAAELVEQYRKEERLLDVQRDTTLRSMDEHFGLTMVDPETAAFRLLVRSGAADITDSGQFSVDDDVRRTLAAVDEYLRTFRSR